MINETLKITGHVTIQKYNSNGDLYDTVEKNNLIVTVGKNFVASRVLGNTLSPMTHMAVGTGTNPAVVSDASLQSEIARVGGANFVASTGSSMNVVRYVATFGPGVGTGALTEAGIFNAATMGDMFARIVYPVVNKAAGDTYVYTWNITFA